MRRSTRAIESYLVAQARASGLGLLEFLILIRAAEPDGVSARDAGRAFGLTTSTMTGIADRLQRDGLVQRRPHPTDRRVLVLRASARGRRTVQDAGGPLLLEIEQLATQLGAEQRAALGGFLDRATALISEHTRAARPAPSARVILRDRAPQRPRRSSGQNRS